MATTAANSKTSANSNVNPHASLTDASLTKKRRQLDSLKKAAS